MSSPTYINAQRPLVVGIAGGTGSGKTTLAHSLQQHLGPQVCVTVSQDRYYKDLAYLEHKERAATNFDHPDSLDSFLMASHIASLKGGREVTLPVYDFAHHVRKDGGLLVPSRPVIIVEGILVLVWKSLRELMDLTVFVDADEKVRLDRRLKRDVAERGRDVQGVLDQYYATVRPMHQAFVEPSASHANLVVDGEGELAASIQTVLEHLAVKCANEAKHGEWWKHGAMANG